jgi:DNA-binding phage protein
MSMSKTTAKPGKSKTKTTLYDATEYLRTPEDRAAHLDAWLTEAPCDTAGIARALDHIARAKA